MLKKTLIAIVLLLFALVVVIVRQPTDFRYSRSLAMAASPVAVFDQVNDLHAFQAWNPWASLDPSAKNIYAGPAAGPGASFSWAGNREVGEGTMTITESQPGEFVRIRMDFKKPMAATHAVAFTFKPAGELTEVTWSMSGQNGFMGKAFGLFVDCDKMCGDQFVKGLERLKAIVEAKPAVD